MDAWRKIAADEGSRAFFKGALSNVLRGAGQPQPCAAAQSVPWAPRMHILRDSLIAVLLQISIILPTRAAGVRLLLVLQF